MVEYIVAPAQAVSVGPMWENVPPNRLHEAVATQKAFCTEIGAGVYEAS